MHDGAPEQVRLNGIDCPEKTQAFGTAAKKCTSDLVFGKIVTVESKGKDRYGRTLGLVSLPDGRSLNGELVKAGMAWWYRAYSNDKSLEALEAEAREAKRGLWADKDPTPPWNYRKAKRAR
jgi:endonuclease YncB( thermonuclease family)